MSTHAVLMRRSGEARVGLLEVPANARRQGRSRPGTASSAVSARGGSAGIRRWSRSAVANAGACEAENAP